MNRLRSVPRYLSVVRIGALGIAVCGVFAACGASHGGVGGEGLISPVPTAKTGSVHRATWVLPNAKEEDLLYTVDAGGGGITIFSYPQGDLVGQIPAHGVQGGGECSDAVGDVFVTTYKNSSGAVYEYAHGATVPERVIDNPGLACAVDPTTGNLAVIEGERIDVYPNTSGYPISYSPGFDANFCTYDSNGNLFVDGVDRGVALSELPKASSSFIALDITSKLSGYASAVQWDGSYLALATGTNVDQRTISRLKVSGSTATVVGSVVLSGNHHGIYGQDWIWHGTVVAARGYGRFRSRSTLWRYPAGGSPRKSTEKLDGNFWGVTVSVRPPKRHSSTEAGTNF